MSETDNKAEYFSIGFMTAFVIFVIIYFTIVREEQTTMRKNPKYKEIKKWAK